jgi:hypothetical protein
VCVLIGERGSGVVVSALRNAFLCLRGEWGLGGWAGAGERTQRVTVHASSLQLHVPSVRTLQVVVL